MTEDINRNFTTKINTSARITSAETPAFFEQQSTHSSIADIIKVRSDILVDMDESITSRSAFYWGQNSIQHFNITSADEVRNTVQLHKRHNRAKENTTKRQRATLNKLQQQQQQMDYKLSDFWCPKRGPNVPGEARAINCNFKKYQVIMLII